MLLKCILVVSLFPILVLNLHASVRRPRLLRTTSIPDIQLSSRAGAVVRQMLAVIDDNVAAAIGCRKDGGGHYHDLIVASALLRSPSSLCVSGPPIILSWEIAAGPTLR